MCIRDRGTAVLRRQFSAGDVLTVAFSPDGRYLLTGDTDQRLSLWDVATGEILHQYTGSPDRVVAADFSPDGRGIVSASDKDVMLWRVEDYGGDLAAWAHTFRYVPALTCAELGKYPAYRCGTSIAELPTRTLFPTLPPTAIFTVTLTPSLIPTFTATSTPTSTRTPRPTSTRPPTLTDTATSLPTDTAAFTVTPTESFTPTITLTPSPGGDVLTLVWNDLTLAAEKWTPTPTINFDATINAAINATLTAGVTPTLTPSVTNTPTLTPTLEPRLELRQMEMDYSRFAVVVGFAVQNPEAATSVRFILTNLETALELSIVEVQPTALEVELFVTDDQTCLLYTSPSPRD